MELFIPSFLILILAAIVVFTIVPKFGPHVITVISLALLTFGVYHHWNMFKSEYRLATWHEPLKQIAPAILIGILLLFILTYILSFFGSGVPVPAVGDVSTAVNSAVTSATNTVSGIVNSVKNVANQATNTVANVANQAANVVKNNTNTLRNNLRKNNIGSLANKFV
jgi:hypothetical protein